MKNENRDPKDDEHLRAITDIYERLRSYLISELDTSDDAARERDNMIEEAADEIMRLRIDNKRLHIALIKAAELVTPDERRRRHLFQPDEDGDLTGET